MCMVVCCGRWRQAEALAPSPFWLFFVGSFIVHEMAWFLLNLPYLVIDRVRQRCIAAPRW